MENFSEIKKELLMNDNIVKLKNEFFQNEFSEEIWKDNYKLSKEEDILDTFIRVAYTIFPDNKTKAFELLTKLLERKISFGGRIISNVGSGLKSTSFFNCYSVQRTKKPYDSLEGIYSDLHYVAKVLKTEGGNGTDFSHIRPRGTFIKGIGIATPGVIEYMKLFSTSAALITKGTPGDVYQYKNDMVIKRKVRKGAQIALIDCRHPDVEEFILAKQQPNNGLEYFNISVKVTDDFMNTVTTDGDWDLWFPDIHFEKYDDEWDGDFEKWEEKGYPKVIYKTVKAKELWNLMMKSMYNRAEPGLLFIDNANKYNNLLPIGMKYVATNPCGEIVMASDTYEYNGKTLMGDICNLGHLNLVSFYTKENGFDWEEFNICSRILVECLDNLIDISGYAFPELENAAKMRRKLGCGVLGYGSLLMMMGMKYGSEEENNFAELLLTKYLNNLYSASALLAKEKGTFELYSEKIFEEGGYIKNGFLNKETKELIKQYGLRNSSLSTTAPTGNTGIFMGMVSGGVEPAFSLEYNRWTNVSHKILELLGGKYEYPEFWLGEFHETKDFKKVDYNGEIVLMSNDGNYIIDRTRGLVKKVRCIDYGYKWCKENLTPEEFKAYEEKGVFKTALDLSVQEHMNTFIIFSKIIDQTISKTVNIPHDYDMRDFEELFINFWKHGGKGITVYREGSMTAVLETDKKEKQLIQKEQEEFFEMWKEHSNNGIVVENVKLPSEYPMRGYEIKSEGKKWRFHVAFKDRQMKYPFAVFIQTNHKESNVNTFNTLELLVDLAKAEKIPSKWIDTTIEKMGGQSNVVKISRMVGLLLRHNVKIEKIVDTLGKVEGIHVGSLIFRLKKFLEYFTTEQRDLTCPNCESDKFVRAEGCFTCFECGYSKCG